MAGTKAGGIKARETNLERYGEDYYQNIGYKGGSAEHLYPRGFAAMPQWKRQQAGAKGGKKSKRGPSHH